MYIKYLKLLNNYPKQSYSTKLSYELRKEIDKMDMISKEVNLLINNNIECEDDLHSFYLNLEKSKIAVDKANIRACYADASYEFISKDWDGSEKTFTEGNVVCSGTVVDTVVKIVYVSGARSNLIHDASQVYFEGGAFVVDGVEK